MTHSQDLDRDVAAVRAMIADVDRPVEPDETKLMTASRGSDSRHPIEPTIRPTCAKPSILNGVLQKIRSYRPQTRTILGTSAVLLAVLQPVLVASILAITLLGLVIAVFVMGADTFWRGVLSGLDLGAQWFPQTARRLRLRCLIAARSWNLALDRVPGGWTEALRMPDLRALARADRQHDDAVAVRLRRLADDTP